MDVSPIPVVVVRRAAPAGPYVPAVGPNLRALLYGVFVLFAFLAATGVYLFTLTALNWARQPQSYTTAFSLWAFLAHAVVGVVGTLPFLAFGVGHWVTARRRPNRVAVRLGVALFAAGVLVVATGFALVQLQGLPQLPTGSVPRGVVYWLHVAAPAAAVWLYVRHRRAGPPIQWRLAKGWGVGVGAFTAVMVGMHAQDPQRWFREGPKEGAKYFEPAATRTADGAFIDAGVLMMDDYCAKCHQDVANDHFHSAHKFSSFNNPAYLFSVRETRKVSKERDGSVRASRWCAGCHDPVPFLSGAFDDPDFDDVQHPTAHAGLTCTVCHAVTHVHGTLGNGGYTLEQPPHYPFARSDNPALQWLNNQLVKAKPDFHKQTFLKPFHKTAEFCATCHKVSLPAELNHYKEFLRGQNHYDPFLLSGVSGHGARAFYFPPKAKENCAACHMPLTGSGDFGAKDFDGSGTRTVHNHRFPAANTGLFELLKREPRYAAHAGGFQQTLDLNAKFLRGTADDGSDNKLRIDIFGLKPGVTTDPAALVAPLRPTLPPLTPGKSYTVEVVVRTLGLGHVFPQGTADSNEIWVDFRATAGGKEVARNGVMTNADDSGPVDRWAHFVNVHMLDRNGNRINRRNPQDIFTPLYDKQIPPGAAAVMHYRLDIPPGAAGPVEITARLRYRKFDHEYMALVHAGAEPPKLPVVDLCEDRVALPLGGGAVPPQQSPVKPAWQRWNDYGIACFLEGGAAGKRGHFRQAEEAFRKLLTLGEKNAVPHGHLNLARVFVEEGRLDEAARELEAAGKCDPPAPWWSRAWFTALVNSETATRPEHLDAAIADLERILDPAAQPRDRGFDFTRDYVVRNRLANRLFKRREFEPTGSDARREFVLRAVREAEKVLLEDAEDVEAHDLLAQCYRQLAGDAPLPPAAESAAAGSTPRLAAIREVLAAARPAFHAETDPGKRAGLAAELAAAHRAAHAVYKPDEIARANATRLYRERHPEANYAARDRVIYPTTPAHRDAILSTGNLP